jgi:dTDP-4-dehydrorhamnose reductase
MPGTYRTIESLARARGPLVILGSTGMLGQALTRVAALRGWHVAGLSRRTRPGADLSALTDITPVLDKLEPALVINAAACTDLAACEADPAAATDLHAHLPGLLAAWGRARRRPWVQISTDHYWCGGLNRLHHEDETVSPPNTYALSKHAGEVMALADPGCLVVRTNLVGFRGWAAQPTFVEWALGAFAKGERIDGYTDVWSSSIEVHQFAQALLELVERGAAGLVNLAARQASSKADFLQALARASGHDPALVRRVPRADAGHPAGPRRANAMGLDVARAEAWLGRKLPNAEQVITALTIARPEEMLDTSSVPDDASVNVHDAPTLPGPIPGLAATPGRIEDHVAA